MNYQRPGWVRVYRKAIDSTIWSSPTIWMVWYWILLRANYEPKTIKFNGVDIEIGEGQFITGINKALLEMPYLTAQRYRTAINYLKSTQRITIKTTNKYSLITIIKWEEYQKDNTQTNKPLTNEQQTINKPLTTNNKDNNIKNEKKRDNVHFESLWLKYPNRQGKKEAERHYLASVLTDQDKADIEKALSNYLQCKTVKEGFIKNGSTWFNNWRDWVQNPISTPGNAPIDTTGLGADTIAALKEGGMIK